MRALWDSLCKALTRRGKHDTTDCRFTLPAYQLQGSKLPDLAPVLEQCQRLTNDPAASLRHLVDYLEIANSVIVDPGRRYRLLKRCLQQAAPSCQALYIKYHKGEAIPESLERKQALIAAMDALRDLNFGFKRVLQEDLNVARRIYRRMRIRHCAQISMELLYAEQRVRALRYQDMANTDWQDCNKLFFALVDTFGVDRRFLSLGLICTKQVRGDKQRANLSLTSVHQLYIAIQLFGLLDHRALSTRQLLIAQNAIDHHTPSLSTEAGSHYLGLRNVAYVSEQLDRPPLFYEAINTRDRFRYMNLAKVRRTLRREHKLLQDQLLMKESLSDKDMKVATGNSREDMDQLMALKVLLNGFVLKRRKETREYFSGFQNAFLCSGFKSAFEILQDNKTKRLLRSNTSLQLSDRLAQYSTNFAESHDNHNGSGRWRLLNESAGGVLIETEESPLIRRLFIGQLALYSRADSQSQPMSAGYVTRLLRIAGNKMQVSIRRFSQSVESVLVQTTFLEKNAMVLPALLLSEDDGDSKLVMHYSHRMTPGQQLLVIRKGIRYEGFIREILELHKEFICYRFKPFEVLVKRPLLQMQLAESSLTPDRISPP